MRLLVSLTRSKSRLNKQLRWHTISHRPQNVFESGSQTPEAKPQPLNNSDGYTAWQSAPNYRVKLDIYMRIKQHYLTPTWKSEINWPPWSHAFAVHTIMCGMLSWQHVSLLLHIIYTLLYRNHQTHVSLWLTRSAKCLSRCCEVYIIKSSNRNT